MVKVGGKRREASEYPRRYKGGANLPTTNNDQRIKKDPMRPDRELPCTCELNGSYCQACGHLYHYNSINEGTTE